MQKAKKRAGRKKTEGSTQANESITSYLLPVVCQFHWKPNRYAYVVGRNFLIASIALGAAYATLTYLSPTAKTTAADKASPDRATSRKTR
jgi:hypothetical protein